MIDVDREIREALARHDAEAPAFNPTDTPVIVRRTRSRQVINALSVAMIGGAVVLAAVLGIGGLLRSDGVPADERPSPAPTAGPDALTGPTGATGSIGSKGRDVVTLDPATGVAELRHDAPTNVQNPDLSPDGETLIYARKGGGLGYQIFAVGPDGVERQLTTSGGSAASWSPDGTLIVFQSPGRNGTVDIYVMNADGSDLRLVADTGGNDVNPDWSPRGDEIAFLSGIGDDPESGIYVVSLADGSLRQLTSAADGDGDRAPAWSTDGEWIAFIRMEDAPGRNLEADDSDIWLVRPDGSQAHRLFDDETQLDPEAESYLSSVTPDGHYQGDPEWSPDARSLAWGDVHAGVTVVDVASQEKRSVTSSTWWDLSWDDHGLIAVES